MNSTQRIRQASRERRDLEKQELRQNILAAAAELFLEQGHENFSLRRVAERIGYAPSTIYNYFDNKDDLLFTVVDEAYLGFKKQFIAASVNTTEPLERLIALGETYLEFGLSHPVHYQLIFMRRSDYLLRPRQGEEQPRVMVLQVLHQAVKEIIEGSSLTFSGNLDNINHTEAYVNMFWAWMHGIVSLAITMPIFDQKQVAQVWDLQKLVFGWFQAKPVN